MSLRTLQCLACGWSLLTRLRSATQISRCTLARETSTTEHTTLVVAPCHINQTHSRNTPAPDISVCCFFFDRSKRATSERCEKHHNANSSHQIDFASIFRSTRTRPRESHDCMSQPSPSTLLRAPRRQRASTSLPPRFRSVRALFALEFWKNGSTTPSARATACYPIVQERRPASYIRMSEKRHAVPDPVVSSHVKSCLTGHCPAT